jgi:hypothetical protein
MLGPKCADDEEAGDGWLLHAGAVVKLTAGGCIQQNAARGSESALMQYFWYRHLSIYTGHHWQ